MRALSKPVEWRGDPHLLGDPVRLVSPAFQPRGTIALSTAIASLALCIPRANGAMVRDCPAVQAALRTLLVSEYAFAERAQVSVQDAFLEYLAEDSMMLNPTPTAGRPIYQAAKPDKNKLEWYPATGDVAPSGDLGFTSGPWIYTTADSGLQSYGHFLTVWKQDANCRWHVQFDGGTSHARPSSLEPKLLPDQVSLAAAEVSWRKSAANDAVDAIKDFQDTAQLDGFAAALRTYGRNSDFVFFTDGQAPIGIRAANQYFRGHPIVGAWKEDARGRSADSTLVYSVGELTDGSKRSTHSYVQIWQFDPKVANLGLRVLLINPLAPAKAN
jgi:hypothetical protein